MPTTLSIGYAQSYADRCTRHCVLGNGYRFYSFTLMRFVSGDDWSPFGAGGMNPYAYCAGDPINFSDPSGHAPWRWVGKMMRRVSASGPDESIAAAQSAPSKFARRLQRYASRRRSMREDRIGLIAAYRAEEDNEAQPRQHYAAGTEADIARTNRATRIPAPAATSASTAEPVVTVVTAIGDESASRVPRAPTNTDARLTGVEGLGPRLARSNSLYGHYRAFEGHGFGRQRLWHEHLFFLMNRLRSLRASELGDDAREEMLGRIRSDIEDTFDALVRDRPQPPSIDAQTAFDYLLPY
jgi:RHS repeat-associated protein